ncbi:hypothetical protein B0T24DRAFT_676540 [Lasiosphaeria ovina]|uniref:Uncharacterized protein n=1 Tax=Lasiosphaeria ovina TaxID=92902 RepID=A0AAE0N9W9_9PEZI|nr:hypothetical protein B0T24DRAFT_676540 [Lasiosphaeria ovina]
MEQYETALAFTDRISRAVLSTTTGDYAGVIPEAVRPRESVFITDYTTIATATGSKTVSRAVADTRVGPDVPVSAYYRLVSERYLHGLMSDF